jgi:GTPase Era involved in 16S rRNA processing
MISRMKIIARNFAGAILDLDDTALPQEQFDLISTYPQKFSFNTSVKELEELLKVLRKKHLVDSITIVEKDGSITASSNSSSFSEGIRASALFSYINSEMPQSSAVMIKCGSWYMLYPYNNRIYIIQAHSHLTTIEMKVIAKEIEAFSSNCCPS